MLIRLVLALTLMTGLFITDVAQSQPKVQMPKEGSFQFDSCWITNPSLMPVTEKEFSFGQYVAYANMKTASPGAAFDRQSQRCWGTWGSIAGKDEELVFCEVVDQDGDKWYLHGHGNPTGGTYAAPYGTGKYKGMVLAGEWQNQFWPRTADVGHGCNPNKGTYKLTD